MRKRMLTRLSHALTAVCVMLRAGACSTTRHVPEGRYLLDDVDVSVNDSTGTLDSQTMMT